MSIENNHNLTVVEAEKILHQCTCQNIKILESPAEKDRVNEAILLLANLSDDQMLGICAGSATEALSVLESYLVALGYNTTLIDDSNLDHLQDLFI